VEVVAYLRGMHIIVALRILYGHEVLDEWRLVASLLDDRDHLVADHCRLAHGDLRRFVKGWLFLCVAVPFLSGSAHRTQLHLNASQRVTDIELLLDRCVKLSPSRKSKLCHLSALIAPLRKEGVR